MNRILGLAILGLYLLLLPVACESSKASASGKGIGLSSQWIIAYFVANGKNVYPAKKAAYITIAADQKSFTGNGGCNQVGGKMQVKGSDIRFYDLFSTEMACDELSDEQRFFEQLQAADHYEISGAELSLMKGSQALMVLESYR